MALDKDRHFDDIALWDLWEEAEAEVEEAGDGTLTCPHCGYKMKTKPPTKE